MSAARDVPYTLAPWLASLTGDHTGHPDAALLHRVGEWIKNGIECDLIGAEHCGSRQPRPTAVSRREADLVSQGHRLRDLIAVTRPQTNEGLKAKALVALWEAGGGVFEEPTDERCHWVAWNLARDILGEDAYGEAVAWADAVNRDYDAHAA